MSRLLFLVVLASALVGPLAAAETAPTAQAIRAAVVKALPLIRKGARGHMAHRSCFACHHQAIPILAMTTAAAHGISVDRQEIDTHLRFIAKFLDGHRSEYLKGRGQGGQVDTAGYALWTLEMGGWKPDATTAAVSAYLVQRDRGHGYWRASSKRPPSEASDFTACYLAVRTLQVFGTPAQKTRITQRISTVRDWLLKTPAHDTEDRVFRLWALERAGADAKDVRAAARELIRSQRPDGGRAQLDTLSSDAYATGTALEALHEAGGLATTDLVYRKGLRFLLTKQLPDGTWHVHSRSQPFQAYFESGFPHGKDQFISLAASGWATTALALALPRVHTTAGGRAGDLSKERPRAARRAIPARMI